MNFKENRLVYGKDFGEWASEFVGEVWGDIRVGASKVWGPIERGANWAGHNLDNLYVAHLAPDKPDPLEDSTPFSNSYEYYHDLEIRYTELYNGEFSKYRGFERQLLECERLKEKTNNEIKQLKKQIDAVPQQVEQHKKAQDGFYSSTPIYKHHEGKIKETIDDMVILKTALKAKYDTTFTVILGKNSEGEQVTEDLPLDKAIEFLELKLEEIEPDMDYYEDNMKRAAYWAQRALDVAEGKSEGEKEYEQTEKKLNATYENQLLKRFESLNYDFEGTRGAELVSRKSFAQEVIELCKEKKILLSELKWEQIFPAGSDIDYDGNGGIPADQAKKNLEALEKVQVFVSKNSTQRVLEGKAEGKKEYKQTEEELNAAYEDQLLKRFENLNYDFKGITDTDELISRRSFAKEVIRICKEKNFPPSELKWELIFPKSASVDYDGRTGLLARPGENQKTLKKVQDWIDANSKK